MANHQVNHIWAMMKINSNLKVEYEYWIYIFVQYQCLSNIWFRVEITQDYRIIGTNSMGNLVSLMIKLIKFIYNVVNRSNRVF